MELPHEEPAVPWPLTQAVRSYLRPSEPTLTRPCAQRRHRASTASTRRALERSRRTNRLPNSDAAESSWWPEHERVVRSLGCRGRLARSGAMEREQENVAAASGARKDEQTPAPDVDQTTDDDSVTLQARVEVGDAAMDDVQAADDVPVADPVAHGYGEAPTAFASEVSEWFSPGARARISRTATASSRCAQRECLSSCACVARSVERARGGRAIPRRWRALAIRDARLRAGGGSRAEPAAARRPC